MKCLKPEQKKRGEKERRKGEKREEELIALEHSEAQTYNHLSLFLIISNK